MIKLNISEIQDIEIKAMELLRDPNLLARICQILERNGLVKERRNKIYLLLCCLSGISKMPGVQQMVQLQASSRAGKTYLANKITDLFKTKKMGELSPTAIKYIEWNDEQVFYFQEFQMIDKEGSSMKLMSAEDGGFTYAVTMKNPDKSTKADKPFIVKEGTVPPMCFVTTTTRFLDDIDPQWANRTHILNIDESYEQTHAILTHHEKRRDNEVLRDLGLITNDNDWLVLKRAIELLDPNVFVHTTTNAIIKDVFGNLSNIRVRSDQLKVASLMRMVAFLYQYQRPFITASDTKGKEKKYIFSLPQDAYYTSELLRDAVVTMTTGLDDRQRKLIPGLIEAVGHMTNIHGEEVEAFSAADIKGYLGESHKVSLGSVNNRLKTLIKSGILQSAQFGTTKLFKLMLTKEELSQMHSVTAMFKNNESMTEKLTKQSRNNFALYEEKLKFTMKLPDAAFELYHVEDWFDNKRTGPPSNINMQVYPVEMARVNSAKDYK